MIIISILFYLIFLRGLCVCAKGDAHEQRTDDLEQIRYFKEQSK